MRAVGLVEYPEHRKIRTRRILAPADCAVKATSPELRLALCDRISVCAVVFQNIYHVDDNAIRLSQMLGPDEFEVICRRMILRDGAVLAPLEQADRQIEARRTVLPLVVNIGRKIKHGWG